MSENIQINMEVKISDLWCEIWAVIAVGVIADIQPEIKGGVKTQTCIPSLMMVIKPCSNNKLPIKKLLSMAHTQHILEALYLL